MSKNTANPPVPEAADQSAAPSAYKRTEVGVIPADWRPAALAEFADIHRGASPRPIKSPRWFDKNSGIGWVRIADAAAADRFYLRATRDYLSQEGVKRSVYLSPGSLIMSICATVGLPVITAMECCIHDGYVVFANLNGINQKYLLYALKFSEAELQSSGQTGSQSNLNTTIVRNHLIPLPPTPHEQDAIAEALSDADGLIGALEKLIAKKRAIKQAAMQQLLTGKTRLPGFDGEWEMKRLGDECAVVTKGTTPTSIGKRFTESGVTFLKVEALNDYGGFITDQLAFINAETHRILKRSQLESGDLLISIAGALGRTGVVHSSILPANTNQALAIVRLFKESEIDGMFLYYSIRAERIQKHFSAISVQGAQANLSLRQISDIPIWCPVKAEQTAIAQILGNMDVEIESLEQRRDKTQKIKQGMMQQLLTGRVRLVNGEAVS